MPRKRTWERTEVDSEEVMVLVEDIEIPDPPEPSPPDAEFGSVTATTVTAGDIIVQSPKVEADPKKALAAAVKASKSGDKSIALIALSLAHAVEALEKRVTELEGK